MSNKKVIIILSIFLISFFSAGLRAAPGTPLTVTIDKAPGQVDPTNSSPINFVVVFSSSVNDFTNENVAIGGTAGATTAVVTGSNTTYNVAVSGMTRSGTVNASIDAGKVHDADGNPNTASNSIEVNYDITPPTVTITSTATSPTKNSPIPMTATFSKTVTGFSLSGITVGSGAASNFVAVSGTVYTFDVIPSGQGTITVDIPAGVAQDAAGNGNTAAAQFSIIYDSIQPTITITSPTDGQAFTASSPVTVSGTASDNSLSKVEIKVGTGDWQPTSEIASWSIQVNLSEGPNTIYARATDTAGNAKEISINVTLDTTAPDSISNPQAATAVGSFFINNSWVNPPNTDFSYVLFKYSNGTELQKVYSSANYLNLKWQPHYTQNISAQTVDTSGIVNDMLVWFNATIPNNPPVQAHIGNKTVYKGQLLTFSISATDADSDTISYGTNANRGSFNSSTGTYTWTPGDGDAGVYVWEFNSSDSYGGTASEKIKVEVKNPLDLDLRLLEPIVVMDENGTSVGIWQDAHVGHIGKLIGYNSTFKNAADVRLVLDVTEIGNNATNDTYKVTLEQNESKSCPDGISVCRVKFEIGPEGVREGFFNFSLKIDVSGYIGQTPVFNYTNLTTRYLPIIPVFKIKQSDAAIAIVSEGRTTTITYVLEANGTVNMTNISIFDPLYPQKYFNISRYEVSGNTSRCYDEGQNQTPCSLSYKYPATTGALSRFKSEESEMGYPYIINMATFSAKDESGHLINDTDYVEICVNKCWRGNIPIEGTYVSRGGGGGGGGGGGIAPSEDINNIERREVREMDILSRTASTYVFRSADPVMIVAFESSTSENAVPVAVEILKNRSKNIKEDAPGKLYKYFNVFVGTGGFSKKVSKGVIAYRVNNSWLKENNIDPADISLYKWQGTWVKLDTEIAENRSNYTYYASLTGNFSSFAIAAAKEQKMGGAYASVLDIPAAPVEQNTTQAMANLSDDGSKHKIPGLSAVAILVFGIAGVIFHLKRNHKKFNRDVRK
jgi:PGF-pre-PGF domain-containing protein